MRTIELSQGYVALVDDKNYERCMVGPKWYAQVARRKDGSVRTVYAIRSIRRADGTKTAQKMHCFIMGETGIDHRDGNGLNNQRCNLRPATKKQNGGNQKLSITNTSAYKGVYWHKRDKGWRAQAKVHGKTIYLGAFVDKIEAARAYDEAALKYHKEFALTNAMLAERAAA